MTTPALQEKYDLARILFDSSGDHGMCCDCCGDYCPQEDSDTITWPSPIARLTVDGIDFVGSKYVIVRADMVAGIPTDEWSVDLTDKQFPWAAIPAEKTAPSVAPQSAAQWRRLHEGGLTAYQSDTEPMVYLWRGDTFAGWATHTTKSGKLAVRTQAEYDGIQVVAKRTGMPLALAAIAYRLARGEMTEAELDQLKRSWVQ